MLEAVILAGGHGSRLHPVTKIVPKALLPLPGGSLLDFQIKGVLHAGITDISIVCGHLEKEISYYVAHQYPTVKIVSQKSEIGTAADGLLELEGSIRQELLIVHGDHYFSVPPYSDLISNYRPGEVTFLVEPPERFPSLGYGTRCLINSATQEVDLRRGRAQNAPSFSEMVLVDGCMIVPPGICSFINQARLATREKCEMRRVFAYMAERSVVTMRAVEIGGWYANINSPEVYAEVVRRAYRER